MALPPTYTIEFTGGDALKFAFQIKDKDLDFPDNPPVPRDLTGWTSLAQVRQTATDNAVLATWTIDPLDNTGIVHMKIAGTITQTFIPLKSVVSDVQLTDPNGDPETVLRLTINVAQDISRLP